MDSDTKDFWQGLLIAAVPIVAASLTSLGGRFETVAFLYFVWAAGVIYALVACVIGFAKGSGGRREGIGRGMVAGVGVGILALGSTCFANMGTLVSG